MHAPEGHLHSQLKALAGTFVLRTHTYYHHHHHYFAIHRHRPLTPAPASDQLVSFRIVIATLLYYPVATFSFRIRGCLPHNRTHRHAAESQAANQTEHAGIQRSRGCRGPQRRHILLKQCSANRRVVEVFASARGLHILVVGA